MGLLDLSEELLELIFRHVVLDASSNNFAHQICVSKKWIDSFLPVLYRDVVLRATDQIQLFTQIPTKSTPLVRSLTLRLSFNPADLQTLSAEQRNVLRDGSSSTKALWEVLKILSETLKSYSGLVTFSVYVAQPGFGFFLPRPILAKLVLSLSKSCENLEIDTRFVDHDLDGEHEPHFCAAIRSVLPQLKHLRLHLKKLCLGLLEGSSKHDKYRDLKTLAVDCCEYAEQSQTTLCDLNNPRMDDSSNGKAGGIIAALLKKLHLAGSFPNATHIVVIERRVSDQPTSENGTTEAQWHSFVWRNILVGHNRLIPYHILGFDQNFNSVYTVRIRTSPQHDLIVSRDVIRKLAHGCFWQISHHGSRFPSEVLNMKCALAAGKDGSVVIPTGMEIENRHSWRERGNRNSMTLWLWEDISGVECLTGLLQEDMERDPVSVFQKVPAGWREVDSGAGMGTSGNRIEPIDGQ